MQRAYIENNDIKIFEEYLAKVKRLGFEEIDVADSLGRITYEAVFAVKCDPMFNASAMDGIVVVAEKTHGANDQTPLTLKKGRDFEYINTGYEIPSKYNSVIMIEYVQKIDEDTIQIVTPSHPWQHIRVKGESIAEGEMVLPSMHKIRPQDISALLASGNGKIKVYKRPKIGIIPTGNEMVSDVKDLVNGKLMESNSHMFAALSKELGAIPTRYKIVNDDKTELKALLKKAVKENDIVIINAGSSAGTKDYSREVIESLGEVFAHGFAIKPGKPTILATIDGKQVFGIPGYPVSANVAFNLFVKPVLLKLGANKDTYKPQFVKARLTKNIVSSFKNIDYVRVSLGFVNDTLVATPISGGASRIMSLVECDGLITVPRTLEGFLANDMVDVELFKSLEEIKSRVVVIGSHDLIVNILGDNMPLVSSHVGSLGGIMTLLKNECHLAPIHLLDEETGVYNIPFIKKYFKGQKMALIKGVGRTQGLMLKKGNPKNIKSVKDLARDDVTFANRQRGAGTRLLFDYQLKNNNIKTDEIKGYEKEFTTHLAVGVAVENDIADVGMGVRSVAMNMGLDFIKIANEEYSFLTYADNLNDERIKKFIDTLKDEKVKEKILSLGDYTIDGIGDVEIIDC